MNDELRAKLSAPIDGVKWRLQQTSPKDAKVNGKYQSGTRGLFMAYIDARDVYDRLDDVIGLGKWNREIVAVNADGSVTGRISIFVDNVWIIQEDIGYSNDPGASHEKEPLKAAASDAFKRAAVGLGIGRFLYELDARWVEIDEWGKPRADLGTGEVKPQKPFRTPEQRDQEKRLADVRAAQDVAFNPQPDLPARARTTTQNPIPRDYAPEPEPEGAASWTAFWAEARRAGLNDKTALTDAGIPMDDFKHAGEALTALRAKLNGVAA